MMERKQSYTRKERTDLIFGVHAVIEALKAERSINKILIQKGIQKETFNELRDALKGQQFQLQFVPNQKLDSLTSGNHQGVIAFVTQIEYQ